MNKELESNRSEEEFLGNEPENNESEKETSQTDPDVKQEESSEEADIEPEKTNLTVTAENPESTADTETVDQPVTATSESEPEDSSEINKDENHPEGDKNKTDSKDSDESDKKKEPVPSSKSEEEPGSKLPESDESTESISTKEEDEASESIAEADENKAEEEDSEEDSEEEEVDYSKFSKEELVDEIKKLSHSDDILKADRKAQEMLPFFAEIHQQEKAEALKKFTEEGGKEEDFEYKNNELDNRFEANFQLIHDKKVQFTKEREKQKEVNYNRKLEILEELRSFVDSDETNISFNKFKELQNQWKDVGPVPSVHNKTLWANYNALIDRFYDKRSIYFELKELDRKKNLEAKIELCEKAEKLKDIEVLKDAIIELNELHNEFKHIGPVPKEEQEALWNRFKSASDAVYSRRKVHFEKLKESLDENLAKKQDLCDEVEKFIEFDSDRIKEWNKKTHEILDLQKKWEAIGGLPRTKAKETNKRFWGSFKQFFHNKSEFFKKLDSQREENLEKKLDLIKQAEELKDSEDFNTTANLLKDLQKKWKEIGPVPEKKREKTYQTFKAACDHFFQKKRENQGISDQKFKENLEAKEAICAELEKLTGTEEATPEKLKELEEAFFEIGFVPRNAIKKIRNRFSKATENFIANIEGLSEDEKEGLQFEEEIIRMREQPNSGNKLYRKEQQLRKQIQQMENDMALWKNNLEFFSDSKTADKLRDEFDKKIENAEEEIRQLKMQLRMIRSAT